MLAELHRMSAEREAAEQKTRTEFDSASARAQSQRSDARQAAIMRFQLDRDSTQREYDSVVAGAKSYYETRHDIASSDLQQSLHRAQSDFASEERRAKHKHSEECWEANTVYEATQNAPQLKFDQTVKEIEATQDVLSRALDLANQHLVTCRLGRLRKKLILDPKTLPLPLGEGRGEGNPATEAEPLTLPSPRGDGSDAPIENPGAQLAELAKDAVSKLDVLHRLRWPHWLIGGKPWGLGILVLVVLVGATYPLLGSHLLAWLLVAGGLSIAAIVAGGFYIYSKAATAVTEPYRWLHESKSQGEQLALATRQQAKQRAATEAKRILEHRDQELKVAKDKLTERLAASTAKRDAALEAAREKHRTSEAEFVQTRDSALAEAHSSYPKRLDEIQKRYQHDLHAAQEQFEAATATIAAKRDQSYGAVAKMARWRRRHPHGHRREHEPIATVFSRLGQSAVEHVATADRAAADFALRQVTRRFESHSRRNFPRFTTERLDSRRFRSARSVSVSAKRIALAESHGRRPPPGHRSGSGHHAANVNVGARPAKYGSRLSTRWAWAKTLPASCTWPITTSSW